MANTTVGFIRPSLADQYERICLLSDPIRQAISIARAAKNRGDMLEEEALISGAMRGEFVVMLMFKRTIGGGSVLIPFIT